MHLTPSQSKGKMLALFTAIFLLKLDKTSSFEIVGATLGKSCSLDKQCATRDSCPYWREKSDQLKSLQGRARSSLIQQFKSAICNKDKKALCCPSIIINDSPIYLPATGECGFNPNKPPANVSFTESQNVSLMKFDVNCKINMPNLNSAKFFSILKVQETFDEQKSF